MNRAYRSCGLLRPDGKVSKPELKKHESMAGKLWQTKSLGLRTDLILATFDGEVSTGDGFIAARTPGSPQFWWGNFVLFNEPPQVRTAERWEAIFDQEVGRVPGIGHRNLAWDGVDGSIGDAYWFVEKGYRLTEDIYLSATKTTPAEHHRKDVTVRRLSSRQEWQTATRIQLASFDSSPSFQAFVQQQMNRNQTLASAGHIRWFGTFYRDEMVATMGLFVKDGLGRCLAVATSPQHRRNGYCSTMVYEVCSYGFAEMGAEEIVIMTTPETAAARVYQSIGFRLKERFASLSISTKQS